MKSPSRIGALRVRFVAPEQFAETGRPFAVSIGRRLIPSGGNAGSGAVPAAASSVGTQSMVIATCVAGSVSRQASGPGHDRRNSQTTLEQLCLPAGERPGVGESLAAVVAGEDDDRVVREAMHPERLDHAADLHVHCLDHPLIGLLRPAVIVPQVRRSEPRRLGLISGRFPRPVRRVEMQAQQERPGRFGVAVRPRQRRDRRAGSVRYPVSCTCMSSSQRSSIWSVPLCVK